jgi:hypothetical protein
MISTSCILQIELSICILVYTVNIIHFQKNPKIRVEEKTLSLSHHQRFENLSNYDFRNPYKNTNVICALPKVINENKLLIKKTTLENIDVIVTHTVNKFFLV